MPVAGIITLIGVGLVVAALAVYLISVALLLRRVSFNLGTIIAGVYAIGYQTEPLGQRFDRINHTLDQTRETMRQCADQIQRELAQPTAKGEGATTSAQSKSAQSKSTGRKSSSRSAGGRRTQPRKGDRG